MELMGLNLKKKNNNFRLSGGKIKTVKGIKI
jgi:hypothetical protein